MWKSRSALLTAYVGRTIQYPVVTAQNDTPASLWDQWITNLAIVGTDGTVTPVLTGETVSGGLWNGCGGSLLTLAVEPQTPDNTGASMGTHFYVGDHLGSASLELTAGGWPIAQSQFMPFGTEISPPVIEDHYRFTGKERDAESGLDYFGARYYASSMGRWMSPDPSRLYYADPENPQSLNLYSYILNNPLKNVDPNGLYCSYGSTDVDVADDSQYDMHSSQSECTAKDENGNSGQWIVDPSSNVSVNADDSGSMETTNVGFNGTLQVSTDYSVWTAPGEEACIDKNMASVQQVSGMNISPANVINVFTRNGATNVDFEVPGGNPQSLSANRYSPSATSSINGSNSLHVPAIGNVGGDPTEYGVYNGTFKFTTHFDTAQSGPSHPIGFLIHMRVDVRDSGAHRKPCGGSNGR